LGATAARGQDAVAIEAGRTIFRAGCARCHGADARGFTAPDLTAAAARPDAETRLARVIKAGVPGTDMPPATLLSDRDIERLIAYLRSLGTPTAQAAIFALPGTSGRGEEIFWGAGDCGACHYVKGRGGRIGPDLSRGISVTTPAGREAAIAAIRRPSEVVTPGYTAVSVVMWDGRRIRGIRKNEDTFSVQMLDSTGRLRGFVKQDVREVVSDRESLMPAYGPDRLTDADVDDLVRYLAGLREAARSTPK
jgi:putative heme-binding domain-containing protein